mgnify:FL=1
MNIEEYKQLNTEERKQFYKEIFDELKYNEDFISVVQETFDKYVSKKCLIELNKWQQLNENMKNMRDEYVLLIKEIRDIKEECKRIYGGSGLRYRIARWLAR